MTIKEQISAEPLTIGQFAAVQAGAAIGQALETQVRTAAGEDPKTKDNATLAKDIILAGLSIALATLGRSKTKGGARTAAGYASCITTGALAASITHDTEKAMEAV